MGDPFEKTCMELERAVHQHWSTCAALCAVLPVERLFAGQAPPNLPWPYVTMDRGHTTIQRTSSPGILQTIVLRLNIWDERLDRAQQVAEEIAAALNRQSLGSGAVRVLDLRMTGISPEQQPDGVWRLSVEFTARVTE